MSIVDRLRRDADHMDEGLLSGFPETLREAADRIEALETTLEYLLALRLRYWPNGMMGGGPELSVGGCECCAHKIDLVTLDTRVQGEITAAIGRLS